MSFCYNESKKPEKLLIFELKIRKRSRVREFETKDQSIARKDLSISLPEFSNNSNAIIGFVIFVPLSSCLLFIVFTSRSSLFEFLRQKKLKVMKYSNDSSWNLH